jgi:paraquat-inducible protein A
VNARLRPQPLPEAHTACPECDLLLTLPPLAPGQRARCRRCGHLLARSHGAGFETPLAFALTAAVCFACACAFPFLSFRARGLATEMSLPGAVAELWRAEEPVLASAVAGFALLGPLALLGAVTALLGPLVLRRRAPWLARAARAVYALGPWSMAEVFLLGVLVSLSKLLSLATVIPGIAFWAYLAFTLCLAATLARLDRHAVWGAIGRLGR